MAFKQNVNTVALPVPRHAQLKEIADKRGVSIADLIGQFVNQSIQKGEIADITPGLEVNIGGEPGTGTPKVTLPIGEFLSRMAPAVARQLADVLEDPEKGKLLFSSVIENPNVVGWDKLRVSGKGVALVLSSIKSGESVTMSRSIAKDVARQLRKTADVIAPLEATKPQPVITREGNRTIIDFDAAK
jgi:hypothetical protein